MPIYEYRCDSCGSQFEEWRRHADDVTEEECPKCGRQAHRLISNTSFVLKGGGWYVTEYGNRKADAHADGAAKDSPEGKSAAQDVAAPGDTEKGAKAASETGGVKDGKAVAATPSVAHQAPSAASAGKAASVAS
ncbi:FmdB family transcriptional regulator [Deltaproteobacteria bacterium]|nr:FmdB family transcriptional regulator [Deltaproteobacteria bacterium]